MFGLYGRKVKLVYYIVRWQTTEQVIKYKDGIISKNDIKHDKQEYCVSEEHKNDVELMLKEKNIEYTIEEISQSNNEWIQELEFDSYEEALQAINDGEVKYLQKINQRYAKTNEQLRADIDYIAIMSGVEI